MDERRLPAVICDDDRNVRHVVGEVAVEALVLVEMTSAHMLVLDLSLTGMSGTEVIASVKAAAPDTAIIIYTAFDTMADLVHDKDVLAVVRKDQPGKLEDALHRAAMERRRLVTRF